MMGMMSFGYLIKAVDSPARSMASSLDPQPMAFPHLGTDTWQSTGSLNADKACCPPEPKSADIKQNK